MVDDMGSKSKSLRHMTYVSPFKIPTNDEVF